MVMSILRMTLCAQVGFLFVELGERVVVALAMLAACDIGCFVHERGGNTASVEFIGGSLEETAQDIGLFGKALGFAHMDAAPALTQIHCMREQCLRLGTCGGAIGAEREVAVDLQFRIRFEGSQPEFGRDRADAGQDHDVGVHFEVFRDLIVAGEEDRLALAREAANFVEQIVHRDAFGNEGIADATTEPAAGAEFLVYAGVILFVEEDRIVGTDEGAPFACAASEAGAESW